jgi:hypothetical protein
LRSSMATGRSWMLCSRGLSATAHRYMCRGKGFCRVGVWGLGVGMGVYLD